MESPRQESPSHSHHYHLPNLRKAEACGHPHPHRGWSPLLVCGGRGSSLYRRILQVWGQLHALPIADRPEIRTWGSLARGTPLPKGSPPGLNSPGSRQAPRPHLAPWKSRGGGCVRRQAGQGRASAARRSPSHRRPAPPFPAAWASPLVLWGPPGGRGCPKALSWADGRDIENLPTGQSPETWKAPASGWDPAQGERQRLWSMNFTSGPVPTQMCLTLEPGTPALQQETAPGTSLSSSTREKAPWEGMGEGTCAWPLKDLLLGPTDPGPYPPVQRGRGPVL